jgi:hypothetical protein
LEGELFTVEPDLATKVEEGTWTSYESPNLMLLRPRPKLLLQVGLLGSGWDYTSRFANVEVTTVPKPFFRRGDANGDGMVTAEDARFVTEYAAGLGPAPPCLDAADADDNGTIGFLDELAIRSFLAGEEGAIPDPGPRQCGRDPTEDGLASQGYPIESCSNLVPVGPFLRGDCNADGRVTGSPTDAIFLLIYNFGGGRAPPCLAACDANADGEVIGVVTDAIYVLRYNFLGGPPPPAPYPDCRATQRPSDVLLGCAESPPSCSE